MKKKFRHHVAYGILRPLLTWYFMFVQGYRPKRFKAENRKQPYLILGNHALASDPILMAASFRQPIYFVASDMIFSIPFVSKLITYLVSPIPKSKYKSDLQTIRNIKKIVKSGGSIGIFPEGNATFSGETMPIPLSTAKLVKSLKIPVVFYRLENTHFIKPRWSTQRRKGKMWGYVHSVLDVNEYADMSLEALHEHINQALYVNHYAIQQHKRIPYRNQRRAEDIESTFFMCPHCETYHQLTSLNHTIHCNACNHTFSIDQYGNLSDEVSYQTPLEWFKAQRQKFSIYLESLNKETTLFEDNQETLYEVKRETPKQLLGTVSLRLSTTHLTLRNQTLNYTFPLKELSVAVQQKNRLIIHHNPTQTTYYCISDPKRNAYKYVLAIALLNETGAY